MQDKQNPIIEDHFIDQAWENMSVKLDAALPAPERQGGSNVLNRSIFLLLIAFLTGLGTGVAAYLTLTKNNTTADLHFEGNKNEITTNWKDVTGIAIDELAQASIYNTIPETHDVSEDAIVAKVSLKQIFENNGTLNKSLDGVQLRPLVSEPIALLPSDQPEPNLNVTFDEKAEEDHVSKNVDSKRVKQTPGVGLIAGMNVFRTNLFGGYYGGLIADYPIARNIVVHAGLTYSRVKDNIAVRHSPIPLEKQGTFGSKNTTSYVRLNELHYINLPLELSYQPFKFVRFSSGFSLGYLIDSDAEASGASLSNIASSASSPYNEPFNEKAWNNWDLSLTYGLSLFPAPNWGLDFNYNFGLTDFTDNNGFNSEEENLHRQYQISVLYYFYRKRQ